MLKDNATGVVAILLGHTHTHFQMKQVIVGGPGTIHSHVYEYSCTKDWDLGHQKIVS